MGYVFKSVAADATNQVTTAWLQNNTTTYADDIHLMEVASSSSQLDRILHNFGTMLDALADNDMIINATKSAVLLRHRGSFMKKWLRRHKQHTPDGDLLYLRTPKGREFRFPIRDQHTYLGVKISYHAMARHTTHSVSSTGSQASMAATSGSPLLQWTTRAGSQNLLLEGHGSSNTDVRIGCS